jgi:hypothetical protein
VALGLYFGKDVLNFAIRADNESGAGDTHYFLAIHIFLLNNAVGLGDFFVGISE